jgi:hypothetical protein
MTLQSSGAISLGDVLTELRIANPGRSLPISLGDTDVRNLAGVPSGAISLSDLYGKSSYVAMSATLPDNSDSSLSNPPSATTINIPMAMTVTGGLAPFSYTWSKVSGSGSVQAVNSPNTNAQITNPRFSTPSTLSELVQCSVTDAMGNTITRQGTATLYIE